MDVRKFTQTLSFDAQKIRADFPALAQSVYGKPLVYLDNAATSQKPEAVLQAMDKFYRTECGSVHRGAHFLSEQATFGYEQARETIKDFINASKSSEIIFVRGATEGINLVASTFGMKNIQAGDEVLISAMEHHSNIVPWQMLCEQKGAHLKIIPINDRGELVWDEFTKLLSNKTKLVAISHVSNALGTINPIKNITALAHKHGACVVVDGAQAIPHMRVDVCDLNCDFYVFSGHKMYGPAGVGVVYGKEKHLNAMPPYQFGGSMISEVHFEKTTFADSPQKFEAGSPNTAAVIGLAAAARYMEAVGFDAIHEQEQALLMYATKSLQNIPSITIMGTAEHKAAVISFVIHGVHAHDVATILDRQGIAIRAGHLCTQPLMDRFKVDAFARVSFAFYNTKEEVDVLVAALHNVTKVFNA